MSTDATVNHGRNGEYQWDSFDSRAYVAHNYLRLRDDDRQIIAAVRDHLAAAGATGEGIDVGSGPSVIPALTMLPFCETITLWEYAASNRRWLTDEVRSYGTNWDPMWDELRRDPAYDAIDDPRAALAAKATVQAGSVFDLPARRWDLGTMFFVACSISRDVKDFERAVLVFLSALRPGAPFALACMEGSTGYSVGGRDFPSACIGAADIERCLAQRSDAWTVRPVTTPVEPLRAGYTGMLLATGTISS